MITEQCLYNKDQKTVTLKFGDEFKHINGTYYIHGGICFPKNVQRVDGMKSEGCLLVAGQNVQTSTVVVFKESLFCCIDHILTQSGNIAFKGVSQEFDRAWATYNVIKYYYTCDEFSSKPYRLSIYRSDYIKSGPQMIHVELGSEFDVDSMVWNMGNTGRIKCRNGGILHDGLRRFEIGLHGSKSECPEITALKAVLISFKLYGVK